MITHGEESYPGQKKRFEERLMELRRIEQEQEIQRLIIKAKRHTENEVKNICVYLQISEGNAIALKRPRGSVKALEKAKLRGKKQKKSVFPLGYDLQRERRRTGARQRSKMLSGTGSISTRASETARRRTRSSPFLYPTSL